MPVVNNYNKNLSSCAQVLGDGVKNRIFTRWLDPQMQRKRKE